ncbi:MAG: CRISPR-associated endonuclease Cas4g/Cas1g [Thermoplasmata archaeon]
MAEEQQPPELLPARMLNEFVYCPRLFYLEWVQGEFVESADTLDGHRTHRRVDDVGGSLPAPQEWTEGLKVKARAVTLSSERFGLVAKLDLLEDDGGKACPVDFKRGHGPRDGDGVWDADRIQVGVQMLLLRDNGYPCELGLVYYAETRKRVPVPWTLELEHSILDAVAGAREAATAGRIPFPLVDSPKCPRCSLVSICLPDEVRYLSGESSSAIPVEVRPLVTARDDALPLYVQAQGVTVAKNGELLEVRQKGSTLTTARLVEVSQVGLFGSVMLTPGALHELCERGVPVCHFSFGGWFYGITHGLSHKNVELRLAQFRGASDPIRSLDIARAMISGKVRNCRTLLRRNHPGDIAAPLGELARIADLVESTTSAETLLALEGAAAKTYFAHFGGLIKAEADAPSFDFTTRNRRPPTDPVNALLSFLYALLAKDATVTLQSVGFDPMLGFFHRPRYGRPSLGLDLMEEFRPLVADSVALSLVNNRETTSSDFVRRGGAVALAGEGRKKVLAAYERRMATEVTHPIFRYTISYRRVLEVQARLLARHTLGEIPSYPPFCTR